MTIIIISKVNYTDLIDRNLVLKPLPLTVLFCLHCRFTMCDWTVRVIRRSCDTVTAIRWVCLPTMKVLVETGGRTWDVRYEACVKWSKLVLVCINSPCKV